MTYKLVANRCICRVHVIQIILFLSCALSAALSQDFLELTQVLLYYMLFFSRFVYNI